MRRFASLALVVGLVALAPASGQAATRTEYVATTDAPCTVACPYWTGTNQDACVKDPITVPRSFHDKIVVVPGAANPNVDVLFTWGMTPPIDYDLWLCLDKGAAGYKYLGHSANDPSAPCLDALGLVGCEEKLTTTVHPGERLVLRAWNWGDGPSSVPAYYCFGVC